MDWEYQIHQLLAELGLEPTNENIKLLCSRNMELFGYYYFPHILTKPNNAFHRWLYKKSFGILDKPEHRTGIKLAVASPRGYAKSSLLSFILPLWCICFEKKKYIILISETQGQAEDFLDDIKSEITGNDKLRDDFPHVCGKSDIRWRQDDVILRNEIRIRAIGCGGRIRGRKYRGVRPQLVLLDDIEGRESVESDLVRAKLWNQWFLKEVMKAGQLDGTTDFIVLGTILHEDSILSKLLDHKTSPDWEKKKFKAVMSFATNQRLWDEWRDIFLTHENEDEAAERAWDFFKENEEEMMEGVEVLWPEGETYYDLMVMCLTPEGESAFLSEKMNDPIDITRVEIRPEDIMHFSYESFSNDIVIRLEEEIKEHPSQLRTMDHLMYYGAWDPSKGKKARAGDYSAITTIGKDLDGLIYVVDIDLKRKDVESRIEDILRLHEKYNYRLFVVETAAFQYFAKDVLVKRAKMVGSDLRYKIKEDTGQTDKILRIQGLAPYVIDGTIRFLHPSHWSGTKGMEYREAMKQLVGFNAGAKHDDFPDSLAMVFELVKYGVFRRKALIDGRTVVLGK